MSILDISDVLIVSIDIVPCFYDIPLHTMHLIVKVLYLMPLEVHIAF
jgi:hypothetical protein